MLPLTLSLIRGDAFSACRRRDKRHPIHASSDPVIHHLHIIRYVFFFPCSEGADDVRETYRTSPPDRQPFGPTRCYCVSDDVGVDVSTVSVTTVSDWTHENFLLYQDLM